MGDSTVQNRTVRYLLSLSELLYQIQMPKGAGLGHL